MTSEDEDVVSTDGAMGQLDGGRIGQCDNGAMVRWPLEQYDNETMTQCHNATTGNAIMDNGTLGQWTVGQTSNTTIRQ